MQRVRAGDAVVTPDDLRTRLEQGVSDAFRLASSQRERPVHHLGLSSLGRCTREGAYRLAGTGPSDSPPPREGRAANLGTWQHEGLLPLLAKVLDDQPSDVEREVVLRAGGISLTGHVDLLYGPAVVDLKTVGEHRLGRADGGPFPDHRVQVGGYALALRQAGHDVRFVAWLYLDRASGNQRVHVQEWTTSLGLLVVDRVAQLRRWALAPDDAPRDERGPGLSMACDECPWLRRCWGEDARPGVVGGQGRLAPDDPAVAAALDLYAQARTRESDARADKEFARAVFTQASEPGTYGAWRWYTGRDTTEPDTSAAVALLAELGVEVPYRSRSGSLQVRPAKAK